MSSSSEIHHSALVAAIAVVYHPKTYLELGLYEGETFDKVKRHLPQCRCIGVDIKEVPIDGEMHACTTDQFFETFEGTVDMVFIDADHKYESALKDFENSLKILSPGGCILLHDTDPENDELFAPGYCGNSYKIVDHLEADENLNIVTFPCKEAGISIITRKGETRTHRREGSK